MAGPRASTVARSCERYWAVAESYIRLPLSTFDVLTAELGFVNLIAFHRGIDRYAWETESFYRLRVHHALRNARAAGTPAGMNSILENLNLPGFEFIERLPQFDWDTTKIVTNGHDFVPLAQEIRFVIDYYWRTCRRYHVALKTQAENIHGPANIFDRRSRYAARITPNTLQAKPRFTDVYIANTFSRRSQINASGLFSGLISKPAKTTLALGNFFSARSQHNRKFLT